MYSSYNNNKLFCERERELGTSRYTAMMRQNDNIHKEIRSLKSHLYELCQQSTADRGLCNRIKSSLDNSTGVTYDAIIKTSAQPKRNNNNDVGTAVVVVDPAKY
ncbi:hypothetical protein HaMNV_gp012 [Helicoverpa armigera multiple nucleopolyhedrovirus]|uniref:Mabr_orf13 n=2 Tax=Alphabaculovirus TaxID=558016 RepID=J7H7G1_NPVMB|nr:hypothetical protein [Mamestra configurata nucleopolyhedrovirus B]ACH88534.1 hypothetical protein HaMNV_gp012 [Helicoverpa armigera multiple nucleopolyhedrovirus]AFP95732.1 Mabr_orf13 [Mamestra brassicae multiple nucleopolyhedrovirus]WNA17392.1 hypothetical protein [Alphabaculovirus mabrassicae]AAM94999.1 hypothetical protein [Mamestra configurata nucleopolyhedrovirus B]AIL25090.1 Orf12 [Mamestra brassicae multiple nucleopolyhedrovirus]